MTKIEFSKDELYFIEKIFDSVAHQETQSLANILKNLNESKIDTKTGRLANHIRNIIRESVSTFDQCRTISAKCRTLKGRDKGV